MHRMSRGFLPLLLAVGLASSVSAQYVPTLGQPQNYQLQINTTSATSNGTPAELKGFYPLVGLIASGTFGGATFTPQVSNDNSNWQTATCYSTDGTTKYNTAGWLNATGTYRCDTRGFSWFRAAITSGTPSGVTISAQGSPTGLTSQVNPRLVNPTVEGTIAGNPSIPSPTLSSPTITGTVGGGATYTSPTLTSPTSTNGTFTNSTLNSPTVTNATETNGTYTNATLATPTITNAIISTETVTNSSIASLTYTNSTLNAMLVGGGATDAVSSATSTLTNGQVYVGITGAVPQATALSAGQGIGISSGPASITISSTVTNTILRGYIDGLTMSTGGGSSTMTIASGQATDSTAAQSISLAASISKTTAAFSSGSGNGCLDTGSIANNTNYYFYLIENVTTSAVDIACSTQNVITTGPTMPFGFTLFRYIGAGRTDGSAHWLGFTQVGDYFIRSAVIADVNTSNPGTNLVTATVTVPSVNPGGVTAIIYVGLQSAADVANRSVWVHDLSVTDAAPSAILSNLSSPSSGEVMNEEMHIRASIASQIGYRLNGSGAGTSITIDTIGYIDRRGKDN